ncbi:MAG: tetratricopeptide repeat protein [Firmicutes bacterium]|nr:tetratricopeptide repeat protein [Bacillota bacterium]
MHNRRFLAVFIILLGALGVFVTAAAQGPFLQGGLQALVYHALQLDRLQQDLNPLGVAISQFENAIRTGEGDEALLLLGLVYQNLDRDVEAAAHYESFLRRNPEEGWAYGLLGDAYLRLGYHDLAEEAYTKAVEFGELARAYYGLGNIFLDSQDYSAARDAFDKALADAPEFVGARVGMGISLYHLEEYEEAAEVLEFSQLLDPRSVEIHQYLALTYDALGRTEQAQHTRERIEQLTP